MHLQPDKFPINFQGRQGKVQGHGQGQGQGQGLKSSKNNMSTVLFKPGQSLYLVQNRCLVAATLTCRRVLSCCIVSCRDVSFLVLSAEGLCFLWLLLMMWFRKRIKMAIAITKEAARAVNDMKVRIFVCGTCTARTIATLTPFN